MPKSGDKKIGLFERQEELKRGALVGRRGSLTGRRNSQPDAAAALTPIGTAGVLASVVNQDIVVEQLTRDDNIRPQVTQDQAEQSEEISNYTGTAEHHSEEMSKQTEQEVSAAQDVNLSLPEPITAVEFHEVARHSPKAIDASEIHVDLPENITFFLPPLVGANHRERPLPPKVRNNTPTRLDEYFATFLPGIPMGFVSNQVPASKKLQEDIEASFFKLAQINKQEFTSNDELKDSNQFTAKQLNAVKVKVDALIEEIKSYAPDSLNDFSLIESNIIGESDNEIKINNVLKTFNQDVKNILQTNNTCLYMFLTGIAAAVLTFAACMITGFNPIAAAATLELAITAAPTITWASIGFFAGRAEDEENEVAVNEFGKSIENAVTGF